MACSDHAWVRSLSEGAAENARFGWSADAEACLVALQFLGPDPERPKGSWPTLAVAASARFEPRNLEEPTSGGPFAPRVRPGRR
eukprot:11639329-Alexandrium_andersonii.AAC.1